MQLGQSRSIDFGLIGKGWEDEDGFWKGKKLKGYFVPREVGNESECKVLPDSTEVILLIFLIHLGSDVLRTLGR